MTKKTKAKKEASHIEEAEQFKEKTFITVGIAPKEIPNSKKDALEVTMGYEVRMMSVGVESNKCEEIIESYVTPMKAAAVEQFKILVGREIILKL